MVVLFGLIIWMVFVGVLKCVLVLWMMCVRLVSGVGLLDCFCVLMWGKSWLNSVFLLV